MKTEKKKPSYSEGPEARKEFEHIMTALFRVPKSVVVKKIKEKSKKGKD